MGMSHELKSYKNVVHLRDYIQFQIELVADLIRQVLFKAK